MDRTPVEIVRLAEDVVSDYIHECDKHKIRTGQMATTLRGLLIELRQARERDGEG